MTHTYTHIFVYIDINCYLDTVLNVSHQLIFGVLLHLGSLVSDTCICLVFISEVSR